MRDANAFSPMGYSAPLGNERAAIGFFPAAARLPSIASLAADRLASHNVIKHLYQRYLEQCAGYSNALLVWLEPSRLQHFRLLDDSPMTGLRRVLAAMPINSPAELPGGGTLAQLQALAQQIECQPSGPLDALRLLLSVEQIDESAWGLLLALIKDAELDELCAVIEPVYDAQRKQRQLIQQCHEELTLLLVRSAIALRLPQEKLDAGHSVAPPAPWPLHRQRLGRAHAAAQPSRPGP